jgi:hypothetical protein
MVTYLTRFHSAKARQCSGQFNWHVRDNDAAVG